MYRFRSDDGVPGGLIIWAVFLIFFALLGVPAVLAILLGAFGGVAVTFILIYWRAEKDEGVAVKKEDSSPFRPMRRLIERLPLIGGFGLNLTPPKRLTRDSATGDSRHTGREASEGGPIRARRPSSSFRDAVRRRKEGSG